MAKDNDKNNVPVEVTPVAVPLNVPHLDASSLVIHATGNNFVLLFKRPVPISPHAGFPPNAMIYDPVASISCSPQTVKDISLMLNDVVADYEKEYGNIHTVYTKQREAAANGE
jgi:hypothetical protein